MIGLTATAEKVLTENEKLVFRKYKFEYESSGMVSDDELKKATPLS